MSAFTADDIRAAMQARADRRLAAGHDAQITDELHAARVAGAFLNAVESAEGVPRVAA